LEDCGVSQEKIDEVVNNFKNQVKVGSLENENQLFKGQLSDCRRTLQEKEKDLEAIRQVNQNYQERLEKHDRRQQAQEAAIEELETKLD
jgi:chromosome segregation ATPase